MKKVMGVLWYPWNFMWAIYTGSSGLGSGIWYATARNWYLLSKLQKARLIVSTEKLALV